MQFYERMIKIKTHSNTLKQNGELSINSYEELVKYMFTLIQKKKYEYSKEIQYYIKNHNLKNILPFDLNNKNTVFKYNERNLINLLNSMNNIFKKIDNIFNRTGKIAYKIIDDYYFNKRNNIYNIFLGKNICDDNLEWNTSIYLLINDFHCGLLRLNNFYSINFNNIIDNSQKFTSNLRLNKQYNILVNLTQKLSEESICAILELSKLTFNDIKNNNSHLNSIDKIINDIKTQYSEINIVKQEIIKDNDLIIRSFSKHIDYFRKKYSDFKIQNINYNEYQIKSKMDLLEYELKYNKKIFNIKITQVDLKLYSYIYYNNKNFSKDRIYRFDDFERIFYIIKEFINS